MSTQPESSQPFKLLPPRADLQHLKYQAKDLLKAARAGDAEALAQLAAHRSPPHSTGDAQLSDAQFAVARRYGFPSWSKLKSYVEPAADLDVIDQAALLLERFNPGDPYTQPMREMLDRQAHALAEAHATGMRLGANHFNNWHPAHLCKPAQELAATDLRLDDARLALAREYGFKDWADAETRGTATPDTDFEKAVDAVRTGDEATLRSLLAQRPELASARSRFGHACTLLHYVGANGVEMYRQRSPKNAAAIAKLLIDAGAEVDALADTYGGGPDQTTLCLLLTSCHPHAAGVQVAVAEVLLDAGAALNGVDGKGGPLRATLLFGYLDAAEMLAARGARVAEPDAIYFWFDKEPALHAVIKRRKPHCVRALLASGADPFLKDKDGRTALDLAADDGELLALLNNNGPA